MTTRSALALAVLALVSIACVGDDPDAVPGPPTTAVTAATDATAADTGTTTTTTSETTTTTSTTTTTTTTTTSTSTSTTIPDRTDDPVSVVFIGDSTARVVAEGLAEVAATDGSLDVAIATRNGCGLMTTGALLNPLSGQWEAVPAECIEQVETVVPAVVAERRPDVVLAMVSSWDVSERRWDDGVESDPTDPLHQQRLGDDYAWLTERLLEAGAGEVVWVLQPTPDGFWVGRGEGQDDDRWQQASRDAVSALAAAQPRVDVLDLVGWMAANELLDDVDTRPDGIHFSPDGALAVGRWIRVELLTRAPSP